VRGRCERGSVKVSTFYEKVVGFDVRLGPRRKLLAIAVLGVGLLTFFVPLITTDPPVLGKTHWSMFDIVSNVYAGDFFPSRAEIVAFPVAVPMAYLLMLCSLVMCFFRSQGALPSAAIAGMLLAVRAWYWEKNDFERMFYTAGSTAWPHVDVGLLAISLLVVIGVFLFITTSENLDVAAGPTRPQITERGRDTGEPEFLDVEILPPEENKAKDPPRLPK
jgi:hypothetical protein